MTDVKQTGAEIKAKVRSLAETNRDAGLVADLDGCVLRNPREESKVSRARGLAQALAEAQDAEIPEQQEAGRRVAAEIVALLTPAAQDTPDKSDEQPQECPYCDGRGWNTVAVHDPLDPDGEPLPEQDQCATCGGTGLAPEKCDHGLPFSVPCEKCAKNVDGLDDELPGGGRRSEC